MVAPLRTVGSSRHNGVQSVEQLDPITMIVKRTLDEAFREESTPARTVKRGKADENAAKQAATNILKILDKPNLRLKAIAFCAALEAGANLDDPRFYTDAKLTAMLEILEHEFATDHHRWLFFKKLDVENCSVIKLRQFFKTICLDSAKSEVPLLTFLDRVQGIEDLRLFEQIETYKFKKFPVTVNMVIYQSLVEVDGCENRKFLKECITDAYARCPFKLVELSQEEMKIPRTSEKNDVKECKEFDQFFIDTCMRYFAQYEMVESLTLDILQHLHLRRLHTVTARELNAEWEEWKKEPCAALALTMMWGGQWVNLSKTLPHHQVEDFAADNERYIASFYFKNPKAKILYLYVKSHRYFWSPESQFSSCEIRFKGNQVILDGLNELKQISEKHLSVEAVNDLLLELTKMDPAELEARLSEGKSIALVFYDISKTIMEQSTRNRAFVPHFTIDECLDMLCHVVPPNRRPQRVSAQDEVVWRSAAQFVKANEIKSQIRTESDEPVTWMELWSYLISWVRDPYSTGELSLASLESEHYFQFLMYLYYNPNYAKRLFDQTLILESMDIKDGGSSRATWEEFLILTLNKLRPEQKKSAWLEELEKSLKDPKETAIRKASVNWFAKLEKEGWTFHKNQGRTSLFIHPHRTDILAVKWLKSNEDDDVLIRESVTVRFLRRYQSTLLKSDYPESHGVFSFSGELPAYLLKDMPMNLRMHVPGITATAYVYSCSNDSYFRYLHSPEIPDESYQKGRLAAMHDLHVLAREGLMMTSLADIFHTHIAVDERLDNGRYIVNPGLLMPHCRGSGSGHLDNYTGAVQYVNMRQSGLADVGDSDVLHAFVPQHPFVRTFATRIYEEGHPDRPVAQLQLLANFLGEYSLIGELVSGVRAKYKKELAWQDPACVNKLADELLSSCSTSMAAFTGEPRWRTNAFIDNVHDLKRHSIQINFWMSTDYFKPMKAQKIPRGVYADNTRITVASTSQIRGWSDKIGFTLDDVSPDLGTCNGPNPIKEGERWRNVGIPYMLVVREANKLAWEYRKTAEKEMKQRKWNAAIETLNKALLLSKYSTKLIKLLAEAHKKARNEPASEKYKKQWAALILQEGWRQRQMRLGEGFIWPKYQRVNRGVGVAVLKTAKY